MAYKTMEDVLDGILAYSESVLETNLSEIESARGVIIPRWGKMARYDILDFHRLKIEILPDDTEPSGGEDETQPMIGDYWNISKANIYITYSDTKPDDITDVIMRYAEAYQKMVRNDESFGSRFNLVTLLRVDYSPLSLIEGTKQFAKIGTVFLQVRD